MDSLVAVIDALYNAPMLTIGKLVWVAVKMQIRAKFSGSNASTWFGLNTVKFSLYCSYTGLN